MATIVDEELKKEIEEYREEERLNGYIESEPLVVDKELSVLNDEIADNMEIVNVFSTISRDADLKVVKKSIELWKQLGIDLHDICSFVVQKPHELMEDDDFNADNLRMISPKKLPVSLEIANDDGIVESYLVEIRAKNKQVEDFNHVFHSIHITALDKYLSSCFYAHEIAHTQINFLLGSCKSMLNSEVISILSEEMFASKLDPSLNTNRKDRNLGLYSISEIITMLYFDVAGFADKMNLSMYIQSYLEAVNMANIYLEGNPSVQKEMQGYINNIFNGNRSVEDMLEHYDSCYEDVPKRLELIRKPLIK